MEDSSRHQRLTRASQPRLALSPHPSPSLSFSPSSSSSSSASKSSQGYTPASASQRTARKEPRQTQLHFPKSLAPKTPIPAKNGRFLPTREESKELGRTGTPTQTQAQAQRSHPHVQRDTPKNGRDVANVSTSGPSASPLTVSMLGKAPNSTLRTNLRQSQTVTRPVEVESDTDEEEMWIQRAQALSGRKKSRVDSPVLEARRSLPASKQPSAQVTPAPPPPVRNDPIRPPSPTSPVTRKQLPAPITPLRPSGPGAPVSVEDSSPQTPHMHCPMEEFSMLPWEHAAALKAVHYRTSAGLKPTERDVQAKRKAEMEMAEKARRAAIARGAGRTTSPVKRVGPATPTHQPPPKRQALAPRMTPNPPNSEPAVARFVCQNPVPVPVPGAANTAGLDDDKDEEAELVKPTPTQFTPGRNLRPRQTRGSGIGTPPPATPIAPLNAIVSPRTNRKVYALETQGATPLPSIFDSRLAAVRRTRRDVQQENAGLDIRPDRPRPARMPSDPDARQEILDVFGDSPLTSEQDLEGSEEERNGVRVDGHRGRRALGNQPDSAGSARSSYGEHGNAVTGRSGHSETAPGGTLSPVQPSSSPDEIPATPYDAFSVRPARAAAVDKAAKLTKAAPRLGDSLTTSRKLRPIPPSKTRWDGDEDAAVETQPLGGAFDDSIDDTVLIERKDVVGENSGCGGEAGGASDDETQALPFGDDDDKDEPVAPPSPANPTGWAGVNAAWEGVDLRAGPASSPMAGSAAEMRASGSRRKGRKSQCEPGAEPLQSQCTLTQYGFPSTLEPQPRYRVETPTQKRSRAKPHMILGRSGGRKDSHPGARAYFAEHPLSRDATDVLSDDEGFEWDPAGEDVDADDSGFVDASAGVAQKSKHKKDDTSSRRQGGPPPALLSGHSADASEADSQETQPLPWDDEDLDGGDAVVGPRDRHPRPRGRPAESSSTCSASDTQDEEDEDELPLAVGARMTPWPPAYGGRARRGSGKGAAGTGPTSSPSSEGSGDGNGWVPSMDVDMGSEVERFFGRLSDD